MGGGGGGGGGGDEILFVNISPLEQNTPTMANNMAFFAYLIQCTLHPFTLSLKEETVLWGQTITTNKLV